MITVSLADYVREQISFIPNGQILTSNNSWDIKLADIDGGGNLAGCQPKLTEAKKEIVKKDVKEQFDKLVTAVNNKNGVRITVKMNLLRQ